MLWHYTFTTAVLYPQIQAKGSNRDIEVR